MSGQVRRGPHQELAVAPSKGKAWVLGRTKVCAQKFRCRNRTPTWAFVRLPQSEEFRGARIVGDEDLLPGPNVMKGLVFFGATRDVAEQAGMVYLPNAEPET